MRATRTAHLIILDLIALTILGKEHRSCSSSLCNFIHLQKEIGGCINMELREIGSDDDERWLE
jgi:hypothetical protein